MVNLSQLRLYKNRLNVFKLVWNLCLCCRFCWRFGFKFTDNTETEFAVLKLSIRALWFHPDFVLPSSQEADLFYIKLLVHLLLSSVPLCSLLHCAWFSPFPSTFPSRAPAVSPHPTLIVWTGMDKPSTRLLVVLKQTIYGAEFHLALI